MRFSFERTVRTQESEQWAIYPPEGGSEPIGSFDMHILPGDVVHATLVLTKDMDEETRDQLVQHLDDDVVNMADLDKGNLFISVYEGREVGHFRFQSVKEG